MKEIKSLQDKPLNKQPSNLEAEQALLGSILINNDIIDEVSTIVNSSIFYDPAHIKIYEVIENLNNKGMIANPITLKNFFEKDNKYFQKKIISFIIILCHIFFFVRRSKSFFPITILIS